MKKVVNRSKITITAFPKVKNGKSVLIDSDDYFKELAEVSFLERNSNKITVLNAAYEKLYVEAQRQGFSPTEIRLGGSITISHKTN